MAYVAQASIDENGKIAGGQAGNQSGAELNTRAYYSNSANPWRVYRAKDPRVANMIAQQAKAGVANKYIGYDQWERNTALIQARKVGWDLSKITVPCETDCSAFDGLCMICAAYLVLGQATGDAVYNKLYSDGNLPATSTFAYKLPTDYFSDMGYTSNIQNGDLLVRDGHAVVVVDGPVATGALSSSGSASGLASSKYPCKGWTGSEVKRVQQALIDKGYSCGPSGVDGDFGKDTDAAVRKFQTDRGLEVDGIVGPITSTALYGSSSTTVVDTSAYSIGANYVIIVDCLRVRTGAGTGFSVKSKNQLTADGQNHSNAAGQLMSGTVVTLLETRNDSGGNPWGRIPSGWICLKWNGKDYVRKA